MPTASKPRHVAVIDIGKTNAKLVLIDRETGTQLQQLSTANTVLEDGPYPHYDTVRLWQFIRKGLKDLHAGHRIDGISITTHGATAALMAGNGLAMPVLDYEFEGPDALGEAYGEVRPDFAESLTPRLPGGLNLGAQIFWQSQAFADDFAKVTSILMYPQYWAYLLTGKLASEATSLGVHTDLWQPAAGDFSSLVDTMGWRALFPPLMPAASVIGTVLPEIADETGLEPATPVACGIHDSNASLLPYLRYMTPPFTVISSGTWTICMTVGGTSTDLDAARDSLANVDAFGRVVPTARFMGGREFALLAGENPPEPTEAHFTALMLNDIFILPGFVPGTGPFPHRKGEWVGAEADELTDAERAAAATLYLAMMTKATFELAGAGARIVVEGPLARNRAYCGLLAELSGVSVHVSGDATGTSSGAAMLFDDLSVPAVPSDEASRKVEPFVPDSLFTYARRWEEMAKAPPNGA